MQGTIAIIDYGVGNVHSVSHALSFLGYKNITTRQPNEICSAAALILPGVGAFGQAMENLKKFDLIDLLNDEVKKKAKPILGICLGMQILGSSSEESPGYEGLGWLDLNVLAIPKVPKLKVPHVGWNTISVAAHEHLFKRLEKEPHFYFDHSYYAACTDDLSVAYCDYGLKMPVIVSKNNITGIQFHPEKSQISGLKLFRNYFDHIGVSVC
jgi:glutamine amidotransferase